MHQKNIDVLCLHTEDGLYYSLAPKSQREFGIPPAWFRNLEELYGIMASKHLLEVPVHIHEYLPSGGRFMPSFPKDPLFEEARKFLDVEDF